VDWTTILVAGLSLLGGGSLVQLFRLRAERTKIISDAKLSDAQTANVLSEAAATQIKVIQDYSSKRIAELESQVTTITNRYEAKIQILNEQIADLNRELYRLRRGNGSDSGM
jgi:hypothetical protein